MDENRCISLFCVVVGRQESQLGHDFRGVIRLITAVLDNFLLVQFRLWFENNTELNRADAMHLLNRLYRVHFAFISSKLLNDGVEERFTASLHVLLSRLPVV